MRVLSWLGFVSTRNPKQPGIGFEIGVYLNIKILFKFSFFMLLLRAW